MLEEEYYHATSAMFYSFQFDTGIILNAHHFKFMYTDHIGTDILRWLLEDKKSFSETALCYAEKYGVLEQSAREIAWGYVQSLLEKKLLYKNDNLLLAVLPDVLVSERVTPNLFEWLEVRYLTNAVGNTLDLVYGLLALAHYIEALPASTPAPDDDLKRLGGKLVGGGFGSLTSIIQAITLAWLLRRRGYDAHFVIAVSHSPSAMYGMVVDGDGLLKWHDPSSKPFGPPVEIFKSRDFAPYELTMIEERPVAAAAPGKERG